MRRAGSSCTRHQANDIRDAGNERPFFYGNRLIPPLGVGSAQCHQLKEKIEKSH
jgi:hypothetical protein